MSSGMQYEKRGSKKNGKELGGGGDASLNAWTGLGGGNNTPARWKGASPKSSLLEPGRSNLPARPSSLISYTYSDSKSCVGITCLFSVSYSVVEKYAEFLGFLEP